MGLPGRAETGAAFGLGAVMASGQAPLGFWWLALPALAALLLLISRAPSARAAAWLGFFGGTGYFALALSWLVQPFLVDAQTYGWMAPFAVLLMAGGLALFWTAAAGIGWRLAGGPRRLLALVLTLTIAELLRGYVLTGFPWALIGHIWIGSAPAQTASLFGPSGLTFMTLLTAALPVAFRWRGAVGSVLILSAATAFGLWRLGQPMPPDRPVTLRLAQPDAQQRLKWDPAMADLYFRRLLDFSAAEPRPDLVIWPETAVPYLLERNPELAGVLADAGRGATLAVGMQREEGVQFFNGLTIVAPDGSIPARYDKAHLVPFGEYMPFGDLAYNLFGMAAFAARQGNGYSAGIGPAIIDLGPKLGRVLPLICYEAIFPQDLLNAPGRADWILQITNDGWFGTLTGPYQHLAQARLRAIEQGLPLIRVANTGISAVIDAKGRILDSLPLGAADFIDTALPAPLAPTPFARFGEVPVLLLLAGLGLSLLITRQHRRP